MERNITIGLVIALVLTCVGAFWMSSHSSDGGGFLLNFLKNSTTNTTTADNSTINETINTTINDTIDNSTIAISFTTAAVFDNSTNSSIISIDASEKNITVDNILLFTSYDNINFTEVYSLTDITLPTTITVPVNTTYSDLYYCLDISYNNATYRVPENGSEVLNISTQ